MFLGQAQVVVYCAHSRREFVALLGPLFEPHPWAVLVDWERDIGPRVAGLLGVLAYITPDSPPERLGYCLRQVAQGYPDAPEPFNGVFHRTREEGPLMPLQRRILSLEAQGYRHDQVAAELRLSEGTLKRRVGELRKRLGLKRQENLALRAGHLGFGPAEDSAR